MLRRDSHLQGAYTNLVTTYSSKGFTGIMYIKCAVMQLKYNIKMLL